MKLSNFAKLVETFVSDFTKEEFLLWKSAYSERDERVFLEKQDLFNSKFFSHGLETDVRRRKNPSEEWFEEAKNFLLVIQERKIFQIKIFLDKKASEIASVYLSSFHKGGESYFEMIIISNVSNAIKIISSCLSDHEGYFDYHDGVEFDELPEPIKVIKIQPPTDPADLEEYNSE